MLRSLIAAAVAATSWPSFSASGFADAQPVDTDANLVTALDASASIMRHEAWIEFDGIARAVVAPAFVEAILRGRHGRIGFAVFTWSSGHHFRVVVPWTIIDSQAAAEGVALALQSLPRPSPGGGGDYRQAGADDRALAPERRTDLSAAIDFGVDQLHLTGLRATRHVLNIVGNGVDNVGLPPVRARQRAIVAETTINGVVVGRDPALVGYFRDHVITGFGSFVLEADDPTRFIDVMITKFLRDLISKRPTTRRRHAG